MPHFSPNLAPSVLCSIKSAALLTLSRVVWISFLLGLFSLVGWIFMVSIFASFVVLLDLGFSALAGEDFFTLSKKNQVPGIRKGTTNLPLVSAAL